QEQAIKQRYQQAYSDIAKKETQAENQLRNDLNKVDVEAKQTQKQVFDTNWQIALARRNLEPYIHISLLGYLLQIFGIRHRATRRV
ncbi:MAG TPA: hypothetical protein VKT32_05100, partial [Chthonomonadaceae bacterium]|nr:hypothetical protein [Chthonomonadaceae bacterium]